MNHLLRIFNVRYLSIKRQKIWIFGINIVQNFDGEKQQQAFNRQLLRTGFYEAFVSFCPGDRVGRAGLQGQRSGLAVRF